MALRVKVKQMAMLRELAKRNMSQNGLARKIEVTGGYMSQVIRGERHPSPATRQKLQDCLSLAFDDIFVIEVEGTDGTESGRESPRGSARRGQLDR